MDWANITSRWDGKHLMMPVTWKDMTLCCEREINYSDANIQLHISVTTYIDQNYLTICNWNDRVNKTSDLFQLKGCRLNVCMYYTVIVCSCFCIYGLLTLVPLLRVHLAIFIACCSCCIQCVYLGEVLCYIGACVVRSSWCKHCTFIWVRTLHG